MSEQTSGLEFWGGVKTALPFVIGDVIPFGVIFGALAVSNGISPLATFGMSVLVLAGSSQFIAVGLVAGGVPLSIIILTTFIVNLRHVLYGASLAPFVKHLPQRWLLPLGTVLTDETYAIAITRYTQPDTSIHKHWFHLGSIIPMYSSWLASTLVGIYAGQVIPNPEQWGLDFVMVVTFTGMVVPLIKSRPMLVSVVAAGISAVTFHGFPNKLGLMAAALAGIAGGMIAEVIWPVQEQAVVQAQTGEAA